MNKDIPFSVKLGAFMLNHVNTINVGELKILGMMGYEEKTWMEMK
jgi:hypothetical protein